MDFQAVTNQGVDTLLKGLKSEYFLKEIYNTENIYKSQSVTFIKTFLPASLLAADVCNITQNCPSFLVFTSECEDRFNR